MTLYQDTEECQRILRYAAGNIILLHAEGKRPVYDDWVSSPTNIDGDGRAYLSLGYNLGFRIPKDHLIIDVDPRNGGLDSFDKLPGRVQKRPITTLSPSGGFHIYTKLPKGFDFNTLRTKHKDYPGIDFLHYGKQVVLPGSRLSDTLMWTVGPRAVFPPPAAPTELIELLRREAPSSGPVDLKSYLTDLELDSILSMIPITKYRDNDSWLRMAMACHHATNGEGLLSFLSWSLADPMYSDQEHIIRRRWESMGNDNTPAPVTIRSLVRELKECAPVPTWLSIRAGLTGSPEEFFGKVEENTNKSRGAFEVLSNKIDMEGDHLALLTTLAAEVGMESSITESMREVLYKKIAKKTGTSVTSIRKDIKILSAPKYAGIDPGTPPEQEEGINLSQPHTSAAQTAIAAMSIEGTPPAYCMGNWYVWDRQKWSKHRAGIDVKREAHKALYNQGTAVTGSAIKSVAEIMQTMMEVNPDTFTLSPEEVKIFTPFNVLNFTNKKGWVVSDPSPEYRNLMTIGTHYDADAPKPERWLRFLKETTTSEQAQRTIACTLIYAAAPCRPWLRKAIYLYGPKRSGKSTLLNQIQHILGAGNCSALNMRQLGSSHGPASLVGKLANISNETLSKETVQDDIFKSLISGESVEVNPKFKSTFIYTNTTKLMFAANGFFRVTDESDATFDRLTIISCPNSRDRAECDTNLGRELVKEAPGILKWAMEIFEEEFRKDACASAMEMDDHALTVMDSWRELNNPALRWLRDRTEEAPGESLPIASAYQDYVQWCCASGHRSLNSNHFGRQIKQEIAPREQANGQRCFSGRRLQPMEAGIFDVLN